MSTGVPGGRRDERARERALSHGVVLHARSLRPGHSRPLDPHAGRARRPGADPLPVPGRHRGHPLPRPRPGGMRPRRADLGARLRRGGARAPQGRGRRGRPPAPAGPRPGPRVPVGPRPDRPLRPALDADLSGDLLPVPSPHRPRRPGGRRGPRGDDPRDRPPHPRPAARGYGAGRLAQRGRGIRASQRRGPGRHGHAGAARPQMGRGQPRLHARATPDFRRRRRVRDRLEGVPHDPAIGGARPRRLARDQRTGDGRDHHRVLDPGVPGPRPGGDRHRALEGVRGRAPGVEPARRAPAPASRRGRPADPARPENQPDRGAGRDRSARLPAPGGLGRHPRAQGRPGPRHHRSERLRQVHPGARARRGLDAGAGLRADRRRDPGPVVARDTGPPHRLPAPGSGAVRRDHRREHRPARCGPRPRLRGGGPPGPRA